MKVLKLFFNEKKLIEQVINEDRLAQKQLFEQFSPKMLSVCRQYIKDIHNAEDVMLGGFVKVFLNIHQYNQTGSFEGWIRKVMVRESISFLRQKKELVFVEEISQNQAKKTYHLQEHLEDYQALIDALPNGCKHVFKMYAIEGYKHQEIAEMLNISVGTSKSQLAYARKILKEQLKHN